MARAATRCIAVRFVVLATACMMALSVIGSAGYVFLHDGTAAVADVHALNLGPHPEEKGEEETDAHTAGSLLFCPEALNEIFAPEFLPPQDGGRVQPVSRLLRNSNYLPRIYRPPIS